MIPTISDYLYRLHHFKLELLIELQKKRAFRFICWTLALTTASILIWVLY